MKTSFKNPIQKLLSLKLIDGWKMWYRFYTTWAYMLMLALPTAYNEAVMQGLIQTDTIPGPAKWAIRLLALYTFAARFIAQNKPANAP